LFGIIARDVRNEQAIIKQTDRSFDHAQPSINEL
jgi:hypothetical protein